MIDEEVRDEDDAADAALEAAFAERQARKGIAPKDVDPPEVVDKLAGIAEPEPAKAEEPEPVAPPVSEPFEGYAALPEAVRKRFDDAQKKAAEADAYAEKLRKREAEYNALHGRVKPLQQYYDQNRSQPAQKPQAPTPVGFDDWLKATSKEYQQWATEFPVDAKVQFEQMQSVSADANKRIQSVEEKVEERFREFQKKAEIERLSRTHTDYTEYTAGTAKGTDLRNWASAQGPEAIAAIESDSADEVSQALSVYKWEKENKIVAEVRYSEHFGDWLKDQSRHIQAMANSLDIEDRKDVLTWYTGGIVDQAPDPNAAKASALAAKRQRQTANVSPLVRQTAAPATAADGSEDAEIDAVFKERQQWRNRNR